MLATKEYELLVKLASEPTRVFTKEHLLREVWGFRPLGRTRTLDFARVAAAAQARGGQRPAVGVNVWGVGYRLFDPD